ncbi:MAG: D-alanine--D-alanine ligase family protein [Actinomycetota bacterium]|nr:D-alanine--D-alanine ligase family protein [Actinomycetota bacterium]
MSSTRLRVAVIFGGRSSEHSISCISAAGVMRALDPTKYEVLAIGITTEGRWLKADPALDFSVTGTDLPKVAETGECAALSPDPAQLLAQLGKIDVVFPVLHGPWGEDGTVQGLLELCELPYVGSGVLASAAGMDKITMKVLLAHAGLPVGSFIGISDRQWRESTPECLTRASDLGLPMFVKPARAGSSRGISKVKALSALAAAVEEARMHDPRVIVEAAVQAGREIECGVLVQLDGRVGASRCAEIVVGGQHEFYDFDAKYLEDSAELIVPAQLEPEMEEEIQALAVQAFEALGCEGLARVDFFIGADGAILINEVNTMPGFTPISMFPRMWQASGLSYSEVLDALIMDAVRRGTGLR